MSAAAVRTAAVQAQNSAKPAHGGSAEGENHQQVERALATARQRLRVVIH